MTRRAQVFLEMPAGNLIGAVFFLLLFIAATTSMVALLEIPVAALTHRLRMRRWLATACMGTAVFLIGVPSALSYGLLASARIGSLGILEAVDLGVLNFLLPAIGIGTAVYVGWRLERNFVLIEADFSKIWAGRIWLWLVRVLVPVTILGILLEAAGVL